MRAIKCPECNSSKAVYTIWHALIPPMTQDKIEKLKEDMEKRHQCFGPNDKNYYCKECDLYF